MLDRDLLALTSWSERITGLGAPHVEPLPADAGERRYLRLRWEEGTRIGVARGGRSQLRRFLRLQGRLRDAGVPVPAVFAQDRRRCFLLIEDLGDPLHLLDADDAGPAAMRVLGRLHATPSRPRRRALVERDLFAQLTAVISELPERGCLKLPSGKLTSLRAELHVLARRLARSPTGLVHWDYHARNVLLNPTGEIGVVDFQDARPGPVVVDVAAFAWDHNTRRTMAGAHQLVDAYGLHAAHHASGKVAADAELGAVFWHLRLLGRLSELHAASGDQRFLRELDNVRFHFRSLAEHADDAWLRRLAGYVLELASDTSPGRCGGGRPPRQEASRMHDLVPPIAEDIDHHYAGMFLVAPGPKVIGQRRDDSPAIDNPGKVAAFGGAVEKGEDPLHAAWREVTEETNLRLDMNAVRYLTTDVARRSLTGGWEVRHFFYAKITDSQLAGLEVYEGAGWAAIPGPDHADLIDSWRAATALLFARVERDARS